MLYLAVRIECSLWFMVLLSTVMKHLRTLIGVMLFLTQPCRLILVYKRPDTQQSLLLIINNPAGLN
jgi:hypothetical protein